MTLLPAKRLVEQRLRDGFPAARADPNRRAVAKLHTDADPRVTYDEHSTLAAAAQARQEFGHRGLGKLTREVWDYRSSFLRGLLRRWGDLVDRQQQLPGTDWLLQEVRDAQGDRFTMYPRVACLVRDNQHRNLAELRVADPLQ